MPGLTGLISDKDERTLFTSMQNSMNHMDYVMHNYIHGGVHLAQISVNRTANAAQGILHSSDARYSLAFTGEIFSILDKHIDSRDSAVLLLDLLERKGLDAVKEINGQFSACLQDNTAGLTYLINDRFGTHPIYYSTNNNRLLFAAEVKSLLKDDFTKKIDYHSLAELFSFGHLFGYKTLFENIHLLPPASILRYGHGQIKQSTYWTFPYLEETYFKKSLNEKHSHALEERLAEVLIAAIRKQSANPSEILVPLSGGLDSRYVAALYHYIGVRDIPTFTMGPDEGEDQQYGTQVAKTLNFPHFKFEIKPKKTWEAASLFSYVSDSMSFISGPLQNFEPLHYFSGTKKVMAASQMCDAIYGSTLWRKRVRILQANKEPRSTTNEILINFFRLYDQNQVNQLFHPHIAKEMNGLYRIEPRKYCRDEFHPLHNYYSLLMNEHGRRGTLGGNIVSNLFYQTRMLSYDNDVFEFGWNLPIVYREHQYLYRKTFCRLFPELARIKRQGYGLKIGASKSRYELKMLENKIATLALKGPLRQIVRHYKPWNRPSYVNYEGWFRGELKKELNSFLTSSALRCSELINAAHIKTLLTEHNEGKRNNAPLLWQIINLEYFFRHFIH